MSRPSLHRIRWFAIVIVVLVVIREWNIRRHEPALGDWPRVQPSPVSDDPR